MVFSTHCVFFLNKIIWTANGAIYIMVLSGLYLRIFSLLSLAPLVFTHFAQGPHAYTRERNAAAGNSRVKGNRLPPIEYHSLAQIFALFICERVCVRARRAIMHTYECINIPEFCAYMYTTNITRQKSGFVWRPRHILHLYTDPRGLENNWKKWIVWVSFELI